MNKTWHEIAVANRIREQRRTQRRREAQARAWEETQAAGPQDGDDPWAAAMREGQR